MSMSDQQELTDISYFPGCSLATTARESNQALVRVCRNLGYRLVELKDWNCCGSSSAHSIDPDLAFRLTSRILSLAPAGKPLLVACPSCILNLRQTQIRLKTDVAASDDFRQRWQRPVDQDLKILHLFELMDEESDQFPDAALSGLGFVPYYGCMLAGPPSLRNEKSYYGLMQKILKRCGAEPLAWNESAKCCGTFLSVSRPDVVEPMVNRIAQGALDSGADCIVTACAMCHLNLEIRCTLDIKVPIFHFSELLALAFKFDIDRSWFSRHLIDPIPMLKEKGLWR